MANQVVDRQTLDGFAPATPKTFTIPEGLLSYDRLSLYIIPIGEDVTVDLKVKFPSVGGGGSGDTVPLLLATGAIASAGVAFIFTTEDLYPGDLLVDITPGGTPPTRVELVAVVKR